MALKVKLNDVIGAEQVLTWAVEAAARHADAQLRVTWTKRWQLVDSAFQKFGTRLTLSALEPALKASHLKCPAKTVGEEASLALARATGTYLM